MHEAKPVRHYSGVGEPIDAVALGAQLERADIGETDTWSAAGNRSHPTTEPLSAPDMLGRRMRRLALEITRAGWATGLIPDDCHLDWAVVNDRPVVD